MRREGNFIVVEGIDGSGKTTLIEGLLHYYRQLEESGGTPLVHVPTLSNDNLSKQIRWMLSQNVLPTDDYTMGMVFVSQLNARYNTIRDILNSGINVIVDRWIFSTLVYNRPIGTFPNYDLLNHFRADAYPDCVLYIDCDPKNAIERISKRNTKEVYENFEKLEDVAFGYKDVLNELYYEDYDKLTLSSNGISILELNGNNTTSELLYEAISKLEDLGVLM